MFNLGYSLPSPVDATSFFRGAGPLSDLRRQMPDLNAISLPMYNWATVTMLDALFLQRPHTDDHIGMFHMAKDVGVPVILDYDDFLFDLPTDNPAYFLYMAPEKQKAMQYLIENADHIMVSTPDLKQKLERLNKNITVVPNAIDMRCFPYRQEPPKRQKRVLWRGSRTHQRDVFQYCQTIFQTHQKFPDWMWYFIGDNLWVLTDNLEHKRTIVMEPMEWPKYFREIWKMAPSMMLVPLHQHSFNYAKSNIAWIEGAFAGAVTIAPAWPEWDRPGVLTYESEIEFGVQMEKVMSGSVEVEQLAADAWNYVQDNLTLEKVNKLRIEVLRSL